MNCFTSNPCLCNELFYRPAHCGENVHTVIFGDSINLMDNKKNQNSCTCCELCLFTVTIVNLITWIRSVEPDTLATGLLQFHSQRAISQGSLPLYLSMSLSTCQLSHTLGSSHEKLCKFPKPMSEASAHWHFWPLVCGTHCLLIWETLPCLGKHSLA